MKKEILILDARRTAIASPFKGLKGFTAAQMAACVVKDLAVRNKFSKDKIDEVIFGNAVAAGTGQNLARQIVSLSDLPIATPGYVVNAVCGSGLQAVILAARTVLSGEARAIVAGAAESATYAPQLMVRRASLAHHGFPRRTTPCELIQPENVKHFRGGLNQQGVTIDEIPARHGGLGNPVLHKREKSAMEDAVESSFYDGLRCALTGQAMGTLCEALAQKNQISREEQDEFACASHQKACTARAAGLFKNEIVGIETPKGSFENDERPRTDMDMKRLAGLPSVFSPEGTITAGNSSSPADGACALLLAAAEFAKENKIKTLARICGYAHLALEPDQTFTGAAQATKFLLKEKGLRVKDIDLFEITESFAAQAIYTQNELDIPSEKMNVFGGDVALGHPLGAAGSRALVTLVHALRQTNKKRGLVAVCFGGGGAIAMVVENIS